MNFPVSPLWWIWREHNGDNPFTHFLSWYMTQIWQHGIFYILEIPFGCEFETNVNWNFLIFLPDFPYFGPKYTVRSLRIYPLILSSPFPPYPSLWNVPSIHWSSWSTITVFIEKQFDNIYEDIKNVQMLLIFNSQESILLK